MKKRALRLVRVSERREAPGFYRCPVRVLSLAGGEVVKRGCGRLGMVEIDGGLRCLYCGHYRYKPAASLESLWFHFRWAREFWKTHHALGRDFVNGFPVTGGGESLPASCLPDLAESRPPGWFARFLNSGENEFNNYLSNADGK